MILGISRARVRLFLCATPALLALVFAAPRGPATVVPARAQESAKAPATQLKEEQNTDGYRLALPGYEYSFPRDHGAHPEFQTEWWYYTGHLKSTLGSRSFGYQLTFFRTAITPDITGRQSPWATRDVIFAHLALTDETNGKFYFSDKISRSALGLADAQTTLETATPRVWLGDWEMQFGGDNGNQQSFRALGVAGDSVAGDSVTRFGFALTQQAQKPPVIHGENGVSQKSAGRGRASHYYSFTRLQTTGTVRIGDQEYSVTGQSWFDHEFGSNQLGTEQVGWDWFSLQLDDGRELMLYQLRLKGGGVDPYSSGTLVAKDGSVRHLKPNEFQIEVRDNWSSPFSKANYPSHWFVTVPEEGIKLEIVPTVAAQELDTQRSTGITYWEGSVRASGSASGKGYVELTGYAEEFDGTF